MNRKASSRFVGSSIVVLGTAALLAATWPRKQDAEPTTTRARAAAPRDPISSASRAPPSREREIEPPAAADAEIAESERWARAQSAIEDGTSACMDAVGGDRLPLPWAELDGDPSFFEHISIRWHVDEVYTVDENGLAVLSDLEPVEPVEDLFWSCVADRVIGAFEIRVPRGSPGVIRRRGTPRLLRRVWPATR